MQFLTLGYEKGQFMIQSLQGHNPVGFMMVQEIVLAPAKHERCVVNGFGLAFKSAVHQQRLNQSNLPRHP